jgi:tetratricopeptide (TPR) repeat protein
MMRQSLLAMLLLLFGLPLAAELSEQEKNAAKYTYDYLTLVEALVRHERYGEARRELDALLRRVEGNVYETAMAHQSYGYVAIGLNDYPKAIEYFQKAIDSGQLPQEVNHSLRFTNAQLLLQESKPKAALKLLKRWFEDEKRPSAAARVLLAQIHYALKQWQSAIREMKRALAQADSPQESWYQFLVGLYLESDQLKPAAELLQRMLQLFPDNGLYWRQLAGVLLQSGRERRAAATLAVAAQKGLLESADLLRLARLYLHQEMPLNAADLLTQALKEGELARDKEPLSLLADAWLLAREQERALKVLGELTGIDRSGRAQLRAGALLFELERWQEAAAMLEKGLRMSDKPNRSDWLLLGVAAVRTNDRETAKKAFSRALQLTDSKPEQEQTQKWLDYLQMSQ